MDQARARELAHRIRKTRENIAVAIGVCIALTLSVYFFTYAMLVDKGLTGLLWAQAISSVLMVWVLFRLHAVAMVLTRLWLGRKAEYRQILDQWEQWKDA